MADPWSWLEPARSAHEAAGLVRRLDPGGPGLLDLASNDYLDLARHPAVVQAAAEAAVAHGAGATGSRLVTGTLPLHLELEEALAARLDAESALVFSSGYLANLAAVSVLSGPGTLVVSMVGNHASLIDACRLSRASVAVATSVPEVEVLLDGFAGRALVVTDAVFSVDGSLADLVGLHEAVCRNGALLLVDEAHGVGVVGPSGGGACELLGLSSENDVVRTVTLSKSLGSQGGAVLGPALLRDHLVDTARPFVFDTGLAPAAAAAALAALPLVTPDRVAGLQQVSRALAEALDVAPTPGAVLQVLVGDPNRAVTAQARCREAGVRVGCFRPPSVPHGQSSLRLTARYGVSEADVTRAAAVVREAV